MYNLGGEKIEIPLRIMSIFQLWNTLEDKKGRDYDKRVAIALLLMCVPKEDLARSKVSEGVKDIIYGNNSAWFGMLNNIIHQQI